jgi:hypothetical protein
MDMTDKIEKKYGLLPGWRKSAYWRGQLKSELRSPGRASGSGGKKKEERVQSCVTRYLCKSRLLSEKIDRNLSELPVMDVSDLAVAVLQESCHSLLKKHTDLVDRRLLKGEKYRKKKKCFPYMNRIPNGSRKGNYVRV